MFFSSRLQRAISRGMKPNGNLVDELGELSDYAIRSRGDANAICKALRETKLEYGGSTFSSPIRALTGLFQDVEDVLAPAFRILATDGQAELYRIFDDNLDRLIESDDDGAADDLLFILKILGMYGSQNGADRIVRAVQKGLKPDAFMWHPILTPFSDDHPQAEYLFESLSASIPDGFVAVSILDAANSACIEADLERHPFDSEQGMAKLQAWLVDSNPDKYSYAHSATVALPFVTHSSRDQLLALAMDHLSPKVQMEAAWAAGKLGRESGLKVLSRFCLDVNHSDVAQRYLAELDREDAIPSEASGATFRAQAEFAGWLAHPNELGEPPDELEVVDHRELEWPPDHEPRPLWVIRYLKRDKTGLQPDNEDCGLVGSMTWCFFTYKMNQRPPEDVYAIHCYWEMQHANLLEELEGEDARDYFNLLEQWQGSPLENARITRVVEVSPKLKTDNQLIGVAAANLNGSPGWVVLDGANSAWYPADEQPDDPRESTILMIHVGRQLLGIVERPDRKKYLTKPAEIDPARFVSVYEKLVEEAVRAEPQRKKDLLDGSSLLARHLDVYLQHKANLNGKAIPQVFLETYRRFLDIAREADPSILDDVLGCFSLVGNKFDDYVEALTDAERAEEIPTLIDLFAPRWDHNLGYGRLGNAALLAGRTDWAEDYFMRLRDGMEHYFRSDSMSSLAEIWYTRGEQDRARELLTDCLTKTLAETKASKYASDQKTFAGEYDHHRATFVRLFSQAEFQQLGLPESAL